MTLDIDKTLDLAGRFINYVDRHKPDYRGAGMFTNGYIDVLKQMKRFKAALANGATTWAEFEEYLLEELDREYDATT